MSLPKTETLIFAWINASSGSNEKSSSENRALTELVPGWKISRDAISSSISETIATR